MKAGDRKLTTLIAIDAALAILIVAGVASGAVRSRSGAERVALIAPGAEIGSISIDGSASLELTKHGDAWTLDGMPADSARVARFIEAVRSIKSAEPVAKGKDSWAQLGLEGDKARRVVFKGSDGAIIASITIGDYAQSGGRVYAAIGDKPSAYSISAAPASYAMGSRDSWLDLRVWASPPAVEQVQELRLSGRLRIKGAAVDGYMAARSGSGWKSGDAELDAAKVEGLIRALINLRASGYAEPAGAEGQADARIELVLGNGSVLALSLWNPDSDGSYRAASSQRTLGMRLPEWAIEGAIKPRESLRKPAS